MILFLYNFMKPVNTDRRVILSERKKLIFLILAAGIIYLFTTPAFSPWAFEGKASWYSRRSPGIKRTTANNERFDDKAMTCAVWGVPFNRKLKVTNKRNGKSVIVRVNDRGPHRRLVAKGRVIDLTKAAFRKISKRKKGLIDVRVERVW